MLKTRRQEPEPATTNHNFWMSYSDLLAAMMLVLVLLLVVALFHYAAYNRTKKNALDRQQQKMQAFHELRQSLIAALQDAFDDDMVRIDASGILRIQDNILFGEDESKLRPEARARLNEVFQTYMQIVLSEPFVDAVQQIEIEGHTNSRGSYLYNLELSQRRALTVMQALLDEAGARRKVLQALVLAGGRAYAEPILDEDGREDPVASRRIEIQFRLKEAELFSDIYQELAQP